MRGMEPPTFRTGALLDITSGAGFPFSAVRLSRATGQAASAMAFIRVMMSR